MVAFSCKTKKVVSPNEYDGNQLILNHGGGFAGTYKCYYLLDNGQLFKRSNEFEEAVPVKSLKNDVVDQIFSNYETLGIDNEKMETYGNLNYSISMISKDGKEHKLNWEKNQKGAEKLQLFYKNIMNHIRLNNEVKEEVDLK